MHLLFEGKKEMTKKKAYWQTLGLVRGISGTNEAISSKGIVKGRGRERGT